MSWGWGSTKKNLLPLPHFWLFRLSASSGFCILSTSLPHLGLSLLSSIFLHLFVLEEGRARPLEPRWGRALMAKTFRSPKNRGDPVITVGFFQPRVQGLPQPGRPTGGTLLAPGHIHCTKPPAPSGFGSWVTSTKPFPLCVTSHPFLFGMVACPPGEVVACPPSTRASLTGGGLYPSPILRVSARLAPSWFTGSPGCCLGLYSVSWALPSTCQWGGCLPRHT